MNRMISRMIQISKMTISGQAAMTIPEQNAGHPKSRRFVSAPPGDRSFCPPTVVLAANRRFGFRSLRSAKWLAWRVSAPLHSASLRSAPPTPARQAISLRSDHSSQNAGFWPKRRSPAKTTGHPASLRQNAGIP